MVDLVRVRLVLAIGDIETKFLLVFDEGISELGGVVSALHESRQELAIHKREGGWEI